MKELVALDSLLCVLPQGSLKNGSLSLIINQGSEITIVIELCVTNLLTYKISRSIYDGKTEHTKCADVELVMIPEKSRN